MREQPLVSGFPQGEEETDLAGVDRKALAELRHARGQQRGGALRAERQSDVGGADHLAGEFAHRRPRLAADHGSADLAHHGGQPAEAAEPARTAAGAQSASECP